MEKDNNLIPSLPKGFRNRWGEELALKKKILNKVEDTFIKYGFVPLETPPMDISSNIGSFLANDEENPMSDVFTFNVDKESLTLRYDMSAPLARFVAQNYMDLVFRVTHMEMYSEERNQTMLDIDHLCNLMLI